MKLWLNGKSTVALTILFSLFSALIEVISVFAFGTFLRWFLSLETFIYSSIDRNITLPYFNSTNIDAFLLSIITLSLFFTSAAMRLISRIYAGRTASKVQQKDRTEYYNQILTSKQELFTHTPAGAISNLMTNESFRLANSYFLALQMVSTFLICVIFILALLSISIRLCVAVILICVLVSIPLTYINRLAYHHGTNLRLSADRIQQIIGETIYGYKTIIGGNFSNQFKLTFKNESDKLSSAWRSTALYSNSTSIVTQPLLILILFASIAIIITVEIEPAIALPFLLLLLRFLPMLQQLLSYYTDFRGNVSAAQNFDQENKTLSQNQLIHNGTEEFPLLNCIKINSLRFHHENKIIIDGLSFTFETKKVYYIQSPSGSGKSTLLDIISGLIQLKRGKVFINDTCISGISNSQYRSNVQYLPQQSTVFRGSLRSNIFDNSVYETDHDCYNLIASMGEEHLISDFPDGLDTLIGDNGSGISGGQRQRIALLRAIASDPKILLLDEALSALDQATENRLTSFIEKYVYERGIVCLYISHNRAMLNNKENVLTFTKNKLLKND